MGANPAFSSTVMSCPPSLPPPPSYRDSQDLYAPSSCTYTVIKYEHLLHSKKQIFWWLSPSTIYQLGTHHKKLSELALFQDCYDICTILQKTLRTNIRKSALMVENTKDGFCLKFKSWWIQEEKCNSLFASVSQWHQIASTKWACSWLEIWKHNFAKSNLEICPKAANHYLSEHLNGRNLSGKIQRLLRVYRRGGVQIREAAL